MAMGFGEEIKTLKSYIELNGFYLTNVQGVVIGRDGKFMKDVKVESFDPEKDTDKFPLYMSMKNWKITGYAIPVKGKGLWSTIYGYLAIDIDFNTVKAIIFYRHGETPGLGGEIEMPWFQNNFKGKNTGRQW